MHAFGTCSHLSSESRGGDGVGEMRCALVAAVCLRIVSSQFTMYLNDMNFVSKKVEDNILCSGGCVSKQTMYKITIWKATTTIISPQRASRSHLTSP